jgi:outer membrane immunogenic protein
MSLRTKIVATVAGVLAVTDLAWGADLPPPPAPTPQYYNWTGLYIGVNAGYASAKVTETPSDGSGPGSATIPGALGGAQMGYNYQIGGVVVGFEADFDGSANTSNTSGAWTAGGGIEAAITDNLSARLEYLYLDTGTMPVAQVGGTPPPPFVTVTGRLQDNLVRMGLNYRLPVAW